MSSSKISPRAVGRGRIGRSPARALSHLACDGRFGRGAGHILEAMSGAPNLLNDTFTATLGSFILESDTKVRLDGELRPGYRSQLVGQLRRRGWHPVPGRRRLALWRQPPAQAPRHVVQFLAKHDRRSSTAKSTGATSPSRSMSLSKACTSSTSTSSPTSTPSCGARTSSCRVRSACTSRSSRSGLSAEVDTGGGSGTAEIGDEGKLNAPLPVIGGRAIWRISGDFWLDAMVQFFALEYENVDGRLIDTRIGVLWQPKKWGGIGIGYNRFDMDVDVASRPVHRQARLDLRRAADLLQRVVLTRTRNAAGIREADRQRAHVPVIGYGRD